MRSVSQQRRIAIQKGEAMDPLAELERLKADVIAASEADEKERTHATVKAKYDAILAFHFAVREHADWLLAQAREAAELGRTRSGGVRLAGSVSRTNTALRLSCDARLPLILWTPQSTRRGRESESWLGES